MPNILVPNVFDQRNRDHLRPGGLRPDRGPRVAHRRGRDPRDDHVDPRHDHRERGAANARARPAQLDRPDPVGGHRLSAVAGRRHPDHGLGRAAVRGQARVHDLAGPVHAGLGPVRVRHHDHRAGVLPRAAGGRRRNDHAGGAAHHGPGRRAQADGSGDGDRVDARDARSDPRTCARRHDPPEPALVLDLPRERSHRHRRVHRRLAHDSAYPVRSGRAPGRDWAWSCSPRPRPRSSTASASWARTAASSLPGSSCRSSRGSC